MMEYVLNIPKIKIIEAYIIEIQMESNCDSYWKLVFLIVSLDQFPESSIPFSLIEMISESSLPKMDSENP